MAGKKRKKRSSAKRHRTRHEVHGGKDMFSEHPHMGGRHKKRGGKRKKARHVSHKAKRRARRAHTRRVKR